MSDKITLRDGLRLRLTQGTKEYASGPKRYDYAIWCAGKVDVGTIGTVRQRGVTATWWVIEWDGIEPNVGYEFGITEDSTDGYEVVE